MEFRASAAARLPPESATWAPAVRILISDLAAGITGALDVDLIGLYLSGSLVTGDFDERISDVDLVAVTRTDLDSDQFRGVDAVHRSVERRHPAWSDRIEVVYLSEAALTTFREDRSPIFVISPGEPFHTTDAGSDWLVNWYLVRHRGLVLHGPPAATLITEISTAELRDAVQTEMQRWRERIASSTTHPGSQAYAILTVCRGLYTHRHSTIVSKDRSADWVKGQLPQWADLIDHALLIRALGGHVGEVDHAETVRFVHAVVDRIVPRALGRANCQHAGPDDSGGWAQAD